MPVTWVAPKSTQVLSGRLCLSVAMNLSLDVMLMRSSRHLGIKR